MWCRTVDIGAHHACWLLLQALFMTASVLMTKSTTRTMNNEVFIAVSRRVFVSRHELPKFLGAGRGLRANIS